MVRKMRNELEKGRIEKEWMIKGVRGVGKKKKESIMEREIN